MNRADATRAAVIPAVVVVLVVLTGLRAGITAAVTVAGIAVVMLAGTAFALVRVSRSARVAPAGPAPVSHCDCCDQACLTAAVCAPGEKPLVTHD